MSEVPHYEFTGFSVWPFTSEHKDEAVHFLERSRQYLYAFKNGRPYNHNGAHLGFSQIVDDLVKKARNCPAFQQSALIVPIPRSGRSEPSFTRDSVAFPCQALAKALARDLPGQHVAVELFVREKPLPPSSSLSRRISLDEHLASLGLDTQYLTDRPVVLVDDLITRGTQSMACALKLRSAGFNLRISGYFAGQVVNRSGSIFCQQPFLAHQITYHSGEEYPKRTERWAWRDCPESVMNELTSFE